MNRPTTALLLFALYLGIAFGLRTVEQLRATGSTGFRGFSSSATPIARVAGALFAGALLLGATAPVLEAFGYVGSLLRLPWMGPAGTAIVLIGVALTYAAQRSMGASWRIGVEEREQTTLVTKGAFVIVRNPIFAAMLVTACGFVVLVPNVVSIVSAASLFVAIELQVRAVEEPYLRRVHGASYERYAAHVGRFLPSFGCIGSQRRSPST